MNEVLRLSTDFLRHIIVTRDPKITTIPSIIEEERRGRNDAAPSPSHNMSQAAVDSFGGDSKVDGS